MKRTHTPTNDGIGNRSMDARSTPASGDDTLEQAAWEANALNQVTQRQQHGSQWVFGHAKAAAQLSITGGSGEVIREGEEFAVAVNRSGAGGTPDWHGVEASATLTGAGRLKNDGSGDHLDVTTQKTGNIWFPASPESFAYDDDGNLYQDGRWTLTWNAENRLTSAETRADVAAATGMPRVRLEMTYDAMGRRIRKVVQSFNTTEQVWKVTSDLRFLHEGMSWNLVGEIEMSPGLSGSTSPRCVRSYAWGTDVSGSIEGAGGVGGLLLVQDTTNSVQAPCYDGNGNISAYVRVATGAVTSRHDYDAFGRPVWHELEGTGGKQVAASPFGFSTKYTDVETGWCYYGFRYYSAELGRWPSRDPIGERGGINLYGMCGNDAVNHWDVLGMLSPPTGRCEVVLYVGHTGDVSSEVSAWNTMHLTILKQSPQDPSQASGLACALPKGANKPYDIPGFVGSGNGLIGLGPDGKATNGGMTPADNPKDPFDNDETAREAYGWLKLFLTDYHAALQSADSLVDTTAQKCCPTITFRLIFQSDLVAWQKKSASAFGATQVTTAQNYLKGKPFYTPPALPKTPALKHAQGPVPTIPTNHIEILFKKK